MVSIKDVAEMAGVSTATVSRVLSDKPHVRPEMQRRVMNAVEKLGYRPNLIARNLRSQQSSTIGLIVADIRNPFFTDISRAVEDTAYEKGFSVYLCNTDENSAKEKMYLNLMQDENVAGVIFSPTRETAVSFSTLPLNFPTVVVDRSVRDDRVDMILIDNVSAGYRLTTHLIENGYRHIGAVFGEASTTGRERRQGFEQALAEHGLAPVHVTYTAPKIEAGFAAASAMLAENPQIDAILATNSLLTAGAWKAIMHHNCRIPDDVALVGFDETTWTTLVNPPVTVIAQPTYEIGKTATELLLQRIAEPNRSPRSVILNGKLIVRGSSAPRRAS